MLEDDFLIILPSNVKGQKNKPQRYKTTFDTPISLYDSPKWEVALTEISFQDSIQTIKDEKIRIMEYSEFIKNEYIIPNVKNSVAGIYNPSNEGENIDIMCTEDLSLSWMVKDVFSYTNLCLTIFKDNITFKLPEFLVVFLTFYPREEAQYEKYEKLTDLQSVFNEIIYKKYSSINNTKWKDDLIDVTFLKAGKYNCKPFKVTDALTKTVQMFSINNVYPFLYYKFNIPQLKETIRVKQGYYKDGNELLNAIDNISLQSYGFKLFFEAQMNKYFLKTTGSSRKYYLEMDESLIDILGFTNEDIDTHKNKKEGEFMLNAKYAPNFKRGIYSLYVYCDACSHIRVGNTLAPLLRVINFQRDTFGKTVNIIYDNPTYIPIAKRYIESIEIVLKDDMGHDIPFDEGKTVISLHFRMA